MSSTVEVRNHERIAGLRTRLDETIDRALTDRRVVGTVVLVADGGEIVYRRAAGFADREAGRSMHENNIFLLSSVAKPIVSAAGCQTSRPALPTAAFLKSLFIIF
jgi:CubicO group peptidase (beta-lactamase class C family)